MKKFLGDAPGAFLVPCYGFSHGESALAYHESLDLADGLFPFEIRSRTYVPRFSEEKYNLGSLLGLRGPRTLEERAVVLRKPDETFPLDKGSEGGYHVCLMVEGPSKLCPEDWDEEEKEVDCFTAWSWTNGQEFTDISGRQLGQHHKVYAGRLGMGVVYYEPQRAISSAIGRTFDLTVVYFQTKDRQTTGRHGIKPDELVFRVGMRIHSLKLAELQGMPRPERKLFDRARAAYQTHFKKT